MTDATPNTTAPAEPEWSERLDAEFVPPSDAERLAAIMPALAEPWPAVDVSWRPGSVSRDRKRAQALPFVDPRRYEDRLNEVCPGDWEVRFRPWGVDRLICELSIFGVLRSSTGEFDDEDHVSKGTSAEAQAFKRACSKFGLGRYLYEIPIVWVDFDSDRRRLADTPELSGRFIPAAAAAPARRSSRKAAAPPAPAEPGDAGALPETLSKERANAMQRELEKLGLPRAEQRTFAAAALGRKVGGFTELTDSEAMEVWNAAKRTHVDTAV